jgi:hypothetical protein
VSTDPVQAASEPGGEASGEPSEEELRAAYEAEISRVTSTDMILQAVVSLLNVGGHRLGFTSEGGPTADESSRDLEQVRDAIDGVRALLPILERRGGAGSPDLRPLRDALSQLQMAYARGAGASAPADPPAAQAPAAAKPEAPAAEEKPGGAGPAQSSGRLWVPGR